MDLPRSRKQQNKKLSTKIGNSIELLKFSNDIEIEKILQNFEKFYSEQKFKFQNEIPVDIISKSVRQLLSLTKSSLNRKQNNTIEKNPKDFLQFQQTTSYKNLVNVLIFLHEIHSNDSLSPETINLATLCVPHILINFFHDYFDDENKFVQLSLIIYTQSFGPNQSKNDIRETIQNSFQKKLENFDFKLEKVIKLRFQHAAFVYGLLNCQQIIKVILSHFIESFIDDIFQLLIKLSDSDLEHRYHLYRLLNQYFKIYYENYQSISESTEFHCDKMQTMFHQSLPIIDINWESQITGLNEIIKETYQYLLELLNSNFQHFKSLILDQFQLAIKLPFTCKSKYRKLAILTETFSQKPLKNFDRSIMFWELPFESDQKFSLRVFKNLSINSLATCIANYYQSTIIAIIDCDEQKELVTQKWSKIWLKPMIHLFESEMIKSTVVQNVLRAHLLPPTIRNIPGSWNVLIDHLYLFPYGRACILRIVCDGKKNKDHLQIKLSPRSIMELLTHSDDMTRAEALALLTEENFLPKNSKLTYMMVLQFLKNNLNIDNATFRQRFISLMDKFLFKIITSLCNRSDSHSELAMYQLKFLFDTLDVLALSLCPGSSFQRKYTALCLISCIIVNIKKNNHEKLLKNNMFNKVPLKLLLFYGIIDKDDKIRRLCFKVLIDYSKCPLLKFDSTSNYSVKKLSIHYIQSFRHQECHIGGLLYKYFLTIEQPNIVNLEYIVQNATNRFYSEEFRQNLLRSSQTDPFHGWILAFNQCLQVDTLCEKIFPIDENNIDRNGLLFDENLRNKIFSPIMKMSFESLDYFLDLLTPQNHIIEKSEECNEEEILEYDIDDDDMLPYNSPSFLEMWKSIKQIALPEQMDRKNDTEDFSSSNQFQLILSMCWLNLKETCFLLSNVSIWFASALHDSKIKTFPKDSNFVIGHNELFEIGYKIVNLMSKCRHKGVIEASAVSLTKFTQSILRIIRFMKSFAPVEIFRNYQKSQIEFFNYVLEMISNLHSSSRSNITRRSAGLALIVQSILNGEEESGSGFDESNTLHDNFVSKLIEISKLPIENVENDSRDLPQANALHILRSIIGTSALSHISCRTVADLFPICIGAFSQKYWQIRNASLQLFGAIVIRMLGQIKRKNTSSVILLDNPDDGLNELDETMECTITFEEFSSRYPSLLPLICEHLEKFSASLDQKPELVPVLALLASFTPVGESKWNEQNFEIERNRLIVSLVKNLSNRCWKIRMLSAKSLSRLLCKQELESLISNLILEKMHTSNQFHGILCLMQNLYELFKDSEDYKKIFHDFEIKFKENKNSIGGYPILEELFKLIISKDHQRLLFEQQFNEEKIESFPDLDKLEIEDNSLDFSKIKEDICFKKSEQVRLKAAQKLALWIEKIIDGKIKFKPSELFSILETVLILFDDEDRSVRFEAQKISTILFHNGEKRDKHPILSRDVAWDCFLIWFSSKYPEKISFIFDILLQRFTISETQIQNFKQEIDVLFEKEDKNVFAEPYLINIRLTNFLLKEAELKLEDRNATLVRFLKIFHEKLNEILILDKKTMDQHEILLKFSIWRLPKLFCMIVNLYLCSKLILTFTEEPETKELAKLINDKIILHFPFIDDLYTNYNSIGSTLIDFQDDIPLEHLDFK